MSFNSNGNKQSQEVIFSQDTRECFYLYFNDQ